MPEQAHQALGSANDITRIAIMNDGYPFNLGVYARSWSADSSPEASRWLNRGLMWSYSFNHEASAACYSRAHEITSMNAMASWGYAYASGPNYNKPWGTFDQDDLQHTLDRCHKSAVAAYRQSQPTSSGYSQVERALCDALTYRYPKTTNVKDHTAWSRAYAHAMKGVYKLFPKDVDVIALYADALMNLNPWSLWDIHTGKPTKGAPTLEVKSVLQGALDAVPDAREHPGIVHLYIHLMEMNPEPEILIPHADWLRDRCQDAAHLQHMPSHVDVLSGDWRQAVMASRKAIKADDKYFAYTGNQASFQALYRAHNYHFGIYASMMSAQSSVALRMVDGLEAALPESLLRIRSLPMADWLEGFLSIRIHVLIRFGRWQDLQALPLPQSPTLYSMTTAMTCYGKGIAYAVLGDLKTARQWQTRFRHSVAAVQQTRRLFSTSASSIFMVAEEMLQGELLYRQSLLNQQPGHVFDGGAMQSSQGDLEEAFGHLSKAIWHDDHLPYREPWSWMMPTRHAFGALSLEQGRVEQAAKVYAQDLGYSTGDDKLPRQLQHPNNVWALHGYHECLVRLGRDAEVAIVEVQLRNAISVADVDIKSSCFCRDPGSENNPEAVQVCCQKPGSTTAYGR